MGFFNDWRSHYAVGYAYGVTLCVLSDVDALDEIVALDRWAYEREWKQNQEGENPNDPMSDKQIKEAKAWGRGARKARGVNPPFYPPYPA